MYKKYIIFFCFVFAKGNFCSSSSSEELKSKRRNVRQMINHILNFQFNDNDDEEFVHNFLRQCKIVGTNSVKQCYQAAKDYSEETEETINKNEAYKALCTIKKFYFHHVDSEGSYTKEQRKDILIDLFLLLYDYKNDLF